MWNTCVCRRLGAGTGKIAPMAIYSASLSAIARSDGRSATAAAAYRAGCVIVDPRTGEIHDYTRKGGVLDAGEPGAEVILPSGGTAGRAAFWGAIELHHRRKDAVTARELRVALPAELPPHAQIQLAREVRAALSQEYGVAVDVCVHEPSKEGDDRNTHAHILMSACTVSADGTMGRKCDALDPIHCARRGLPTAAEFIRPLWERLVNEALAEAGSDARIDHRSHAARGLTEVPGSHHGPAVTDMLRNGRDSDVADRIAAEAAAILSRQVLDAQAAAELLEAQAAQALADLAAELELERVQALREAAEAAEREAQARAAQEAAERAQAAEQAAQAQALAAEQAQEAAEAAQRAVEAQRQAAEREEAQRQAAERLQAAQAAERALAEREAAQRAVDAAERQRQALWPAYNAATVGQREAGASLLATARALPKAAGWQRAIDAYNSALQALARAQAVLVQAGKVLAAAMQRLEAVDPATRERREARERANQRAYDDQQRRIAQSSAAAAAAAARGRQRGRVAAHHQVQWPQEDDQERDAPDVPRM